MQRISIIGSGNVASCLSRRIDPLSDYSIEIICSRNIAGAKDLSAELLSAPPYVDSLASLPLDSDFYFFCVSDDALPKVVQEMPETKGIWLHVSGSLPLGLLTSFHANSGVFYPLQTLSKKSFSSDLVIPIYIEGSCSKIVEQIKSLAQSLTPMVYFADSEKRAQLHLAAVFANNFTNHLYAISSRLVSQADLPCESLYPLLQETLHKAVTIGAETAQTGPAQRGDNLIISRHVEALADHPSWQEVYCAISQSILMMKKENKNPKTYE